MFFNLKWWKRIINNEFTNNNLGLESFSSSFVISCKTPSSLMTRVLQLLKVNGLTWVFHNNRLVYIIICSQYNTVCLFYLNLQWWKKIFDKNYIGIYGQQGQFESRISNFLLESMFHNNIIGLQSHRFGLENISQ